MLGLRIKARRDRGNACDERLRALLREWQGIEAQPNFEVAVWRGIRASTTEARTSSLAAYFREWILPRPVWSAAIAAAVAIVIGGLAGFSASTTDARQYASEPLLHPRTLAGSYLYATTEGNQ